MGPVLYVIKFDEVNYSKYRAGYAYFNKGYHGNISMLPW